MRLLLDACVWAGARSELVAAGHDVVYAGDWPDDPGDEEILSRANGERRVLVTLDKDFGEWAILRGVSHSGILRLVNCRAARHGDLCLRVLARHGDELTSGAIVTAEPTRLRIRPPD
jgi:predicted nuclease of predicted toxin-antitoxin system